MRTDRRRFILGALGCGALARALSAAPARGRDPGRTLVLVQLTGGNDGLSTLVPHGDDAYGRARSATRWSARDVLRVDARVGLHPELRGLHALHGQGRLALFEGVGYPGSDRSHGRALDAWHAADPRGRAVGEGWVGRLAARLESADVTALVHVGPRPPFALQSRARPPLQLASTSARARLGGGAGSPVPRLEPEEGPSAGERAGDARQRTLELLRRASSDAEAAGSRLRAALDAHEPRVRYPGSPFASDLASAAALIHAGIGVRVCSLELDGFDTHRDQRARHDARMRELDQGLTAFVADLSASDAGRETLVLVFSEFGRRLAENASRGTDHGAAGLAFALGAEVRGGLHGAAPSLTELEDGDPRCTTDFRSVYARVIEHVSGVAHEEVLGERFPMQDWV